jgi:hypothetical protein
MFLQSGHKAPKTGRKSDQNLAAGFQYFAVFLVKNKTPYTSTSSAYGVSKKLRHDELQAKLPPFPAQSSGSPDG